LSSIKSGVEGFGDQYFYNGLQGMVEEGGSGIQEVKKGKGVLSLWIHAIYIDEMYL
jgi:hypothetical protein